MQAHRVADRSCNGSPECRSAVRVSPDGTWRLIDASGTSTGQVDSAGTAAFADWFRAAVDTVDLAGGARCPAGVPHVWVTVGHTSSGSGAEPPDPLIVDTSSCRDAWPHGFATELTDKWNQAGLPAPDLLGS